MVIVFLAGAVLSGMIGSVSLAFKRNKYTKAIDVICALVYVFCVVFTFVSILL